MSFQDQVLADAVSLLSGEEFSEEIIYTPYGQAPRTIRAIITRTPMRITKEGGREWPENVIDLYPCKDADAGVPTPKSGVDTAMVPYDHPGSTPVMVRIVAILEEDDPGLWHLVAKR